MDAQGLMEATSGDSQTLLIGIFACVWVIVQILKAIKNFRDSPADRTYEQGKSIAQLVDIIKEKNDRDRDIMAEAMNKMSTAVTAMAGLDKTFSSEITKLGGTMDDLLTEHKASNVFQSKLANAIGETLGEFKQLKIIERNADKYRRKREANGNLDPTAP